MCLEDTTNRRNPTKVLSLQTDVTLHDIPGV
jgi:hypothetical protein